jgi:hypothetical protein
LAYVPVPFLPVASFSSLLGEALGLRAPGQGGAPCVLRSRRGPCRVDRKRVPAMQPDPDPGGESTRHLVARRAWSWGLGKVAIDAFSMGPHLAAESPAGTWARVVSTTGRGQCAALPDCRRVSHARLCPCYRILAVLDRDYRGLRRSPLDLLFERNVAERGRAGLSASCGSCPCSAWSPPGWSGLRPACPACHGASLEGAGPRGSPLAGWQSCTCCRHPRAAPRRACAAVSQFSRQAMGASPHCQRSQPLAKCGSLLRARRLFITLLDRWTRRRTEDAC